MAKRKVKFTKFEPISGNWDDTRSSQVIEGEGYVDIDVGVKGDARKALAEIKRRIREHYK